MSTSPQAPALLDVPTGVPQDARHAGVGPVGVDARQQVLAVALADPRVRARYEAKVHHTPGCWYWSGALHARGGHGRFWVTATRRGDGQRRDVVVIAHRFGWAMTYGLDSLTGIEVLAHTCDEPSCQRPEHLRSATSGTNQDEWLVRRWHPRSPLRDVRGPGGRSRAIRAAIIAGGDVDAARAAGISNLDADQLWLW